MARQNFAEKSARPEPSRQVAERRMKRVIRKVLFGIVFVIFSAYAISLLFPFVFLLINAFKGSL